MKPKKRKGKGTILILAGIALLLASLGLTGYNFWDNYRAAVAANRAMAVLDKEIVPLADHVAPENYGELLFGETQIPDYILDPDMEMPVLEVDGNRYIGYLEIPALELKLPVLDSWSYPNLKLSPCRYSGSPYRDNLVIAAHNYPDHFGRLRELVEGDEVRFTDVDGNVFVYTVAETEQLAPRPASAMLAGDWQLSLFTCTVGGQFRMTLRCTRA